MLWNLNSLCTKYPNLRYYLDHCNIIYHSILLNETKLQKQLTISLEKMLLISNYTSTYHSYSNVSSGIATYTLNSLQPTLAPSQFQPINQSKTLLQWQLIKLPHFNHPIIIGNTYIPPDSPDYNFINSHDWMWWNQSIQQVCQQYSTVIIMGDMNTHSYHYGCRDGCNQTNIRYNAVNDTMITAGFHCLTKDYMDSIPSHYQGHTIDLVFTSNPELIHQFIMLH